MTPHIVVASERRDGTLRDINDRGAAALSVSLAGSCPGGAATDKLLAYCGVDLQERAGWKAMASDTRSHGCHPVDCRWLPSSSPAIVNPARRQSLLEAIASVTSIPAAKVLRNSLFLTVQLLLGFGPSPIPSVHRKQECFRCRPNQPAPCTRFERWITLCFDAVHPFALRREGGPLTPWNRGSGAPALRTVR
jgi:hypothetical protein